MNGQKQGSTRARIQAVALELFAEQGYDGTSLREIADRLGVTKAALYYHFKTKDDILASTVEDFLVELDDIIEWGRSQPPGAETRREVIRRYADIVQRRQGSLRFFHQNQARTGHSHFKQRMRALRSLLHDPDAEIAGQIRALSAIATLHSSQALLKDCGHTEQELHDAALALSLELVGAAPATTSVCAAAPATDPTGTAGGAPAADSAAVG